jgi:hypothetical protein
MNFRVVRKLVSDKSAIFDKDHSRGLYRPMADSTEPKKETVRIPLTPPSAAQSPKAPDTVRITLPTRPPASAPPPPNPPGAGTPRPPIAKPLVPPARNKPVQDPRLVPPPLPPDAKSNAPPASSPVTPPPVSLKKETARITALPDPAPAPASVQMKKTQPLIGMPAATAPAGTGVAAAPETAGIVDQLPMTLCWALVGVSAVILIIQILNYIS